MQQLPQITVYYQRRVTWTCPHCGQSYAQTVDDLTNIADVPQVGETLTCAACRTAYMIGQEELS
jgi:phage terminase large subunit GpA-like protein